MSLPHLSNVAHLGAQPVHVDLLDVTPIDGNGTLLWVIEPGKRIKKRKRYENEKITYY